MSLVLVVIRRPSSALLIRPLPLPEANALTPGSTPHPLNAPISLKPQPSLWPIKLRFTGFYFSHSFYVLFLHSYFFDELLSLVLTRGNLVVAGYLPGGGHTEHMR